MGGVGSARCQDGCMVAVFCIVEGSRKPICHQRIRTKTPRHPSGLDGLEPAQKCHHWACTKVWKSTNKTFPCVLALRDLIPTLFIPFGGATACFRGHLRLTKDVDIRYHHRANTRFTEKSACQVQSSPSKLGTSRS